MNKVAIEEMIIRIYGHENDNGYERSDAAGTLYARSHDNRATQCTYEKENQFYHYIPFQPRRFLDMHALY